MMLAPIATRVSSTWICPSCRSTKTIRSLAKRCLATSAGLPKRSRKLPDFPARTRFAPSPTGYLHLGSLRTALYNYLLAKATGGQFLLRIEDTDQSRTVPDALDRICRDLEWAGLQWDEGPEVGGPYGPYIQSERISLYQEHANKLIESGHAYRCFCTAERLQELAQMRHKLGQATHYDRTCAGISKEESDDRAAKGEQHVVRLKAPPAQPGYDDLVYGRVGKQNSRKPSGRELPDDAILLKSDGRPTYHLANVVDDHLMKITHVIRAVEWMPSTPKHVHLYQAFGWKPPAFAHVGLLQGLDGQKLSKRQGDQDISTYRENGTLPETLLNFVSLLGWHPNGKTNVMNLQEMIEAFDLSFTKGNAVVNFPKLAWFTKEHIKKHIREKGKRFNEMVRTAITILNDHGITQTPGNTRTMEEYVALILKSDPLSYTSLATSSLRWRPFFLWDADDPVTKQRPLNYPQAIEDVHKRLARLPKEQWMSSNITQQFKSSITCDYPDLDVPISTAGLLQDLRQLIMAGTSGPGIADAFEVLGRDETLDRFSKAGPFN